MISCVTQQLESGTTPRRTINHTWITVQGDTNVLHSTFLLPSSISHLPSSISTFTIPLDPPRPSHLSETKISQLPPKLPSSVGVNKPCLPTHHITLLFCTTTQPPTEPSSLQSKSNPTTFIFFQTPTISPQPPTSSECGQDHIRTSQMIAISQRRPTMYFLHRPFYNVLYPPQEILQPTQDLSLSLLSPRYSQIYNIYKPVVVACMPVSTPERLFFCFLVFLRE